MIKKIITGVTTLGLAFGIVSTAGAKELPTSPSLPIQGIANIQADSPISPFNISKHYSKYEYYEKSKFPTKADCPNTIFVTTPDGYYGTLTKQSADDWGKWESMWQVYYSGTVTKFVD